MCFNYKSQPNVICCADTYVYLFVAFKNDCLNNNNLCDDNSEPYGPFSHTLFFA